MSIVSLEKAIAILKQGSVVALPTETVYGLAGLINNERALKKIFSTKERPFFDPLIIHVKDLKQAEALAEFGPISQLLAKKFWPGPLTLVLPKKDSVSELITSGGPTVALRSPSHPIAQQVLAQIDCAFAAPSANKFGHTSPTSAQHVIKEFESSVSVVDGGECEKGIESTIVEVDEKKSLITLLRPGMVTTTDIEDFLNKKKIDFSLKQETKSNAPGHLKNHYQPQVTFVLVDSALEITDGLVKSMEKKFATELYAWELPPTPELAARQLYGDLRLASSKKTPIFLAINPQWKEAPEWSGIMDRLQKACHFYLEIDEDGVFSVTNKH